MGLANWLYFRLPVTLCFLKTASLCFLLLGATKVVKKKQTEKDKEGTGAFTIWWHGEKKHKAWCALRKFTLCSCHNCIVSMDTEVFLHIVVVLTYFLISSVTKSDVHTKLDLFVFMWFCEKWCRQSATEQYIFVCCDVFIFSLTLFLWSILCLCWWLLLILTLYLCLCSSCSTLSTSTGSPGHLHAQQGLTPSGLRPPYTPGPSHPLIHLMGLSSFISLFPSSPPFFFYSMYHEVFLVGLRW